MIKKLKLPTYLPYFLTGITFLSGFLTVARYASNVPLMDEWEFLNPGAFDKKLNWIWVFEQHNEHRIVFTNLINWLSFKLDHWNLLPLIVMNWFLYGGAVWAAFHLTRDLPKIQRTAIAYFLPFFFLPLATENHLWAFQSQFHFFLLFFFCAVSFLFDPGQSRFSLGLALFFSACSAYSFSSGVVCSLVLIIAYLLQRILMARESNSSLKLRTAVTVGIALSIPLILWMGSFHRPGNHPSPTLPYQKRFWWYLINVLSLGFGIGDVSFWISVFWSLLVFGLFVWSGIQMFRNPRNSALWKIGSASWGIGASLCTVTVGRAGFGIAQSKSARYAEIGAFLLPFLVAMIVLALQKDRKRANSLLILLWIVLAISFSNKLDPKKQYAFERDRRRAGLQCIRQYYHEGGNANCPTLYPSPLRERLENAKRLNLSFYQQAIKSP